MTQPISGNLEKLAIKKAATWGTAVACGAGDGLLFRSGGTTRSADVVVDDSRGLAFSTNGTAGPVKCDPSYEFPLRYVGADLLIALFMGIAGAPVQQGATTAYKNIYKWNKSSWNLICTIAKSMVNYIEEVPTAKVNKIEISGQVGAEPLALKVGFIGINKEPASSINTTTTFLNVTIPTGADLNAVLFSQLVFRMNDQSGAALGSGDVINPNKFTISLERPEKGEYTGEYRTTTTPPQDLIDQPVDDGQPVLKLTLGFAKHINATYMTALGSDTRKKLDITATGALIASTYYFQHLWQFPHLQMTNANPADSKGRIMEDLEFIIHGCNAAPTGMTGITDPLWWTVINTRTTDPLA